jgi:hypothetical protein
MFLAQHPTQDIEKAVHTILDAIDLDKLQAYSPDKRLKEAKALQILLKWKMNGDGRSATELLAIINDMLDQPDFF